MSEERDWLRARVASGDATGDERDRLAQILSRAIRERDDRELETIEAMIDELRVLADAGSDRTSCTDALAGALLDAQIRAFERGDRADAWRRLDEIRARLLDGGTPDLLHDRLAAALYNMIRGGELLGDRAMRLAAFEELRTRAYTDPSAAACRVALAELLADGIGRDDDPARARILDAELQRLHERDAGVAVAREYARGTLERLMSELALGLAADTDEASALLTRLRELDGRYDSASADPIRVRLAEAIVASHAWALRGDESDRTDALRDELRRLLAASPGPSHTNTRARGRTYMAIARELGKALHDAAVLTLGLDPAPSQLASHLAAHLASQLAPEPSTEPATAPASRPRPPVDVSARAMLELRALVGDHELDGELRRQLMSALFQVHRDAIECGDDPQAERLQAEADALLDRDDELTPSGELHEGPSAGVLRRPRQTDHRRARIARTELRLDHLRMLLATHARAGDRGDWLRAEQLLTRARSLVERAGSPLEMVELLGQMLVNAHVDAGRASPSRDQHARALLTELRALAKRQPRSPSLQLHLATALFNAHVDAGRRHSTSAADALLDELVRHHRAHPAMLELRRRLLMALVNHHGDALERQDLERASSLLEQIASHARASDADDHLRVQLAMALGNELAHSEDTKDERSARLVGELRVLAGRSDASETLRTLVLDELSELFAPKQ